MLDELLGGRARVPTAGMVVGARVASLGVLTPSLGVLTPSLGVLTAGVAA
jgi:hypothetical protein